MKITYLKRRGGKTTRAIKECLETGATLVVVSRPMARELSKQHPTLRVATHDELLDGDSLRGVREIIVDDADTLIMRLAQCSRIRRITLSKPFTKADCKKWGSPLDMVGQV